jgi:hypothetical protein
LQFTNNKKSRFAILDMQFLSFQFLTHNSFCRFFLEIFRIFLLTRFRPPFTEFSCYIFRNLQDATSLYKDAEIKSLELTNGIRLNEEDCTKNMAEVKARNQEQKAAFDKLQKEIGLDRAEVEAKLKKAFGKKAKRTLNVAKNQAYYKSMSTNTKKRVVTLHSLRALAMREVRRNFCIVMKNNDLRGNVQIDLKEKIFDINVVPSGISKGSRIKDKDKDQEGYVKLTSLSGGERSKTLVCLILAMWQALSSPFRGLDEWDVFLDDKARKTMERMLVESSKIREYQFFFISPQNSVYNNSEEIKKNKPERLVEVLEIKI